VNVAGGQGINAANLLKQQSLHNHTQRQGAPNAAGTGNGMQSPSGSQSIMQFEEAAFGRQRLSMN